MSEDTVQPTETPVPTSDDASAPPAPEVTDSSEDGDEGDVSPPPPPAPPPREPVADAEALLRKFDKVSITPRFSRLRDGMQHMAAVFGDFHPAVDALRAGLVKLFDDA